MIRPADAPASLEQEGMMFNSIVVGTDGSDTAAQAVREAVQMGAALGA